MDMLAIFEIKNSALNTGVSVALLILGVLYLALIFWTFADARRRIDDPLLVVCATLASFFPFVGTIVYLIVRPPEFLEDVRERELEIAAAEARLAGAEHHTCPYCNYEIEKTFLVCPSCMHRLKEPCTTCGKPLDPRWKVCPYCEAEVGAAPAQQQPRRERRPRRERPAAATGESPTQVAGAEPPPRRTKQRPPREDGEPRREAAPQRKARPAERPAAEQPQQRERPTRPARS